MSAVSAAGRPQQISRATLDIFADALVWDNHGCMLFDDAIDAKLERYRRAGVNVAVINICDADAPLEFLVRSAATLRALVANNADRFVLVSSVNDIEEAQRSDRLAVAFDVEGAFSIGDQIELLQLYYDLGVRWMLMVYNVLNLVGSGCQDPVDEGLTAFGLQVVREMERVGIIKCCSHTGPRTAMEVLQMSAQPCIFSHSNPSTLKHHPRNISDELMRACARTGGVVCINGLSWFMREGAAGAAGYADHIDYAVQTIGMEHVGIGLDYCFDQDALKTLMAEHPELWPASLGYGQEVSFVAPEDLPEVAEKLLRRGYSEDDLRAVLGGNLLRIARQVWK